MIYVILACFLTVLIELTYLRKKGYDTSRERGVIICTNIVTNVCLNMFILWSSVGSISIGSPVGFILMLLALEAAVVFIEYGIYCLAFGSQYKLLLQTFIANLFSFFLGGAVMTGLLLISFI